MNLYALKLQRIIDKVRDQRTKLQRQTICYDYFLLIA